MKWLQNWWRRYSTMRVTYFRIDDHKTGDYLELHNYSASEVVCIVEVWNRMRGNDSETG